MTEYDSNLSRRQFLKRSLWGAVGLGVMGAGGYWTSRSFNEGTHDILFTAPTSYDIVQAGWSQLKANTGIGLSFTDNGNDVGPVLAKMIGGTMAHDFDVQGLQGGAEPELAKAGVILPWDEQKIPNWSSVWSWAKDIPYTMVDGKRYSIPIALNADSIIYLPDEVSKVPGYESGVVDSYNAVFDSKLAGRTSMEDAWINSAIFTAIYLKGQGEPIKDPGDLTLSELKQVMTFLIDKKKAGQFRRFWQGWEQGVQLIRSGEVIAMTGWEPIVKALQKDGLNAEYAVPKEGYEGWTNTLLLQAGARDRNRVELAHTFANWLLDGYYGCALVKLRGYVVPSSLTLDFAKSSKEFLPAEVGAQVQHVRDKLMHSKVYWQNVRPKEYRAYDEWWNRLRSA